MSKNEPNVNRKIKAKTVLLISETGEQLGVIPLADALNIASGKELDLVEVSDTSSPPVCKIMDYGKYKYKNKKKGRNSKKKQHTIQTKELRLRPLIEQHDLNVKIKHAKRFLEQGNKVQFTLRFRGREVMYRDLGLQLLDKIKLALDDLGIPEDIPKSENEQSIIFIISPKVRRK